MHRCLHAAFCDSGNLFKDTKRNSYSLIPCSPFLLTLSNKVNIQSAQKPQVKSFNNSPKKIMETEVEHDSYSRILRT